VARPTAHVKAKTESRSPLRVGITACLPPASVRPLDPWNNVGAACGIASCGLRFPGGSANAPYFRHEGTWTRNPRSSRHSSKRGEAASAMGALPVLPDTTTARTWGEVALGAARRHKGVALRKPGSPEVGYEELGRAVREIAGGLAAL